MTTNKQYKEVKVNFHGVFATIKSVEELKHVAQSIVNQTNEAYKARLAELAPSSKGEKSAEVVSIETKRETENASASNKTEAKKSGKTTAKSGTKTTKAETKKSDKEEVKQALISNLTKEDIKRMGIRFELYSEKCISLTGETKSIKEQIKKLAGGHWNHARQCWFLKKDNGAKLAKMMGQKVYKKAE